MLETGIPNLDRILGGGIPTGDVVLIVGPPGSGKTTLSFQLAFHTVAAGGRAVYVSTLSEPPARIVRHLRSFTFFDESQLGKNLFMLPLYPLVKQGIDQAIDALIAAAKDYQATLLIVDGLNTVRDLYAGTVELRTFIYELAVALSVLKCTTLLTQAAATEIAHENAEFTMSDSVVLLGLSNVGTQTQRTVQLQKVRGQEPLLGVHSLRIDRDGVHAFPRSESIPLPPITGLNPERLAVGLPELDAMMKGGLLRGSVSLLAGAPGTGKTLLGLQYILAGTQRGEKGLILGFREAPGLLVDKLRSFGMDLETPLKQGLLKIIYSLPIELVADEVFDELRRALEDFGPKRLLVDSLAELEYAVADRRRQRNVLICFAELIRGHGVTALVAREMTQGAGPELDFSDSPLASLAENLILLRYVEFHSELYRILSVLKMRDTEHDRTIRQYKITNQGLAVLAPVQSGEGILTGIAGLPSEMRVKRSAPAAGGER